MRPPVELGAHRAPRCEPVVSLVRSRRAPPVPLIVLPKSCSCRWGPCPPPPSLVWVSFLSFFRRAIFDEDVDVSEEFYNEESFTTKGRERSSHALPKEQHHNLHLHSTTICPLHVSSLTFDNSGTQDSMKERATLPLARGKASAIRQAPNAQPATLARWPDRLAGLPLRRREDLCPEDLYSCEDLWP